MTVKFIGKIMIELNINGKKIKTAEGRPLLEVAQENDLHIPTLCYLKEAGKFASCMVCMVKNLDSGKLIPACSSIALVGMNIETESEEIQLTRKAALELLLSEHIGDCEAICRVACPARVNIPEMIRKIKSDDFSGAAKILLSAVALPRIIGRICHAPCQKACKRGRYDEPVSIRDLERFIADKEGIDVKDFRPNKIIDKKIGIIGSGPTGLATAFHVLQLGYKCIIFEKNDKVGGTIRGNKDIPEQVLEEEINVIRELGCEFRTNTEINKNDFEKLIKEYDALVVATGAGDSDFMLDKNDKGIKIKPGTYETSQPGVFAGGDVLATSRQAIKAVADGRSIAFSIDVFLKTGKAQAEKKEFDSRTGNNSKNEIASEVANASPEKAVMFENGYNEEQALQEAKRCLNCDCAKATNCRLRDLATEYQTVQNRYKGEKDKSINGGKSIAGELVFEPGKCIKCGICVRISQKYDEPGLTFIGRGITTRIAVPFGDPLGEGVNKAAKECVESCPTAALAWKRP